MAGRFTGQRVEVDDWPEIDQKMLDNDSDFVEVAYREQDFSKLRLRLRYSSSNSLSSSSENISTQKEFERLVTSWVDINPGMFCYLKYVGFWHAVLVTSKDVERSVITAVHYGVPKGLLERRKVTEDEFRVNLTKDELWEVVIPEAERVSPEQAVRNARSKRGETKFNMFTRRSSHMVRECLMKKK